jgi:hypothetical protein
MWNKFKISVKLIDVYLLWSPCFGCAINGTQYDIDINRAHIQWWTQLQMSLVLVINYVKLFLLVLIPDKSKQLILKWSETKGFRFYWK